MLTRSGCVQIVCWAGLAAKSMATELESERDGRKRKISAGSPPPAEEEVIGPMPVAPENAAKKRKKGERPGCCYMEVKIVCQFNSSSLLL